MVDDARSINEAVARKLGWTEEKLTLRNDLGNRYGHKFINPADPDENECDCPNTWSHGMADYCHSIGAAWEIVDYIRKRSYEFSLLNHNWQDGSEEQFWECKIDEVAAEAPTAPMAICLAFLKLGDR